MIELVQSKYRVTSIITLQNFLMHVFVGLFVFKFQSGLFSSELVFGLLTIWLCLPFFSDLKLGLSHCILSILFCYSINLVHPIWSLFIFFSLHFFSINYDVKTLLTRSAILVLGSVFLQKFIFIYLHSKSYLLLSLSISIFCFLDFFFMAVVRLSLETLVIFNVYNFIEESFKLENRYQFVLEQLKLINSTNTPYEKREFLTKSYNLNFKLFLLSFVKLWSTNIEVDERYNEALKEVNQIRNNLRAISEKLNCMSGQESLQGLDELKQQFVELNLFFEDYDREVKNLME